MKLDKERLHLAGWLSIANAVLALPMVVLMPLVSLAGLGLLVSVVIGIRVCMFGYTYLVWRETLKAHFAFHDADTIITIMLNAVALMGILSILAFQVGDVPKFITVFALLGLVSTGVLSILLGARMLRLPDSLFGLLRPYAHTVMASGVLLLTVLCLPFSALVWAAADVILGVILFRISEKTAA